MPGPDPGHWLHRLTAAEWLAAAETELHHADEALGRRAVRPAAPDPVRAAARTLRETSAAPPALVKLGRAGVDTAPLEAARAIVAHARSRCQVNENG